jgi:hypothetical protein
MFMVDKGYQIRQRTAQFYAAQLITQEWAEPRDAIHKQFLASSDVKDGEGHTLVTAYALQRPDQQWALLVINKDHDNLHPVRVVFEDNNDKRQHAFAGAVEIISFGRDEYQWHPGRKNGSAHPDKPPAKASVNADNATVYTLPAASVTVVRGHLN